MEENIIKRQMPNSLEAEQAVIGSMITDQEAIVKAAEILKADDFYYAQYGAIFDAIVELYNHAQPTDIVTLQNKLREKGLPPEVTSTAFISELVTAVPVTINIESYAKIVKEKSELRSIIRVNQEIENACFADDASADVLMEKAEHDIFALMENRGDKEYKDIHEITMDALEAIEKAAEKKGAVTGISTGFTRLDYRTAGLQPSDLILIAARPSMGKTAFALNIAQYVGIRQNLPTAIFSLEMSREQLMNRLFAMEAAIDAQKLRTGNLQEAEWEKLVEAVGVIANSSLMIDDTPSITVSELRSKCRKLKAEHGLSLVLIDYLQLMNGSGKSESRQQEISEISRSLKALARELKVPIIALSQLSRAVEQRPDHRPMLSDLRESGAIEQDADVVMFIYRDEYYHPDTELKGISEIIVAKQRNGPIGTTQLAWLPEYTKFGNLDYSDTYHDE